MVDFSRVAIAKGQSAEVTLFISPFTYPVVPDSENIFTDGSLVSKGSVNVFVGGGQPDFTEGVLQASFDITSTKLLSTC